MAEPRKIELQSMEDLQYLIANIQRGANEKIDQALPPMEGEGEDAMRKRVAEDVHDYINQVFLAIGPNITINGLSPKPDLMNSLLTSTSPNNPDIIEEHEPFNQKLFEKAKELARQEEDLIEEIATLRRKVPNAVVENTKKRFREETEADEEALRRVDERIKQKEKERIDRRGGDVLGVGKLERQDEVERNWEKGVKGLEKVVKTMPETVAKCERAGKAETYVNGMDGK
ncbi:hypothetical protein G7Y89_g9173 [Cudoniella acicularis]|uniref:Uncharacterized protein n=1 Tax=Cudoniella acicularis TaxID=354080 RepID=A0A8H4W259_9HELO|nr:hypothetical protein G7Y89_g9173 [Cudoniella acicularis]